MSEFITEQVKKASHSSDMIKHQNYVDIEQMERDQGGKVRNYCKLEPNTNVGQDDDIKSKVTPNAWDRPYRSHIKPNENTEERNAISRIALRLDSDVYNWLFSAFLQNSRIQKCF